MSEMLRMYIFFAIGCFVAAIAQWVIYWLMNRRHGRSFRWYYPLIFLVVIIIIYPVLMFYNIPLYFIFGLFLVLNIMAIYWFQYRENRSYRRIILNAVLCSIVAFPLMFSGMALALIEPFCCFAFPDTTIYAPAYTEANFSKIKYGMSTNEVISMIGEPLRKVPNRQFKTAEAWIYSESKGSSHYRTREIDFNRGTVVKKHSGYYID